MKKNIAIVTGGDVAERNVSLQSAKNIALEMDKNKYNIFIIELNKGKFTLQGTDNFIDLNDFSLRTGTNHTTFDLVYLMLHGHPAEDGNLQGYLNLIGMPFTGCNLFTSAITFGKQATKDILKKYHIPMAHSILLTKNTLWNEEELLSLGLPLFVKPITALKFYLSLKLLLKMSFLIIKQNMKTKVRKLLRPDFRKN
jgi:D-alanine-D-alanine ligase